MENQITQVIIVNKNPADMSMQIVIPPFRPINIYELEDSHEDIILEIKAQIHDSRLADHISGFIEALHDAIETQEIIPVIEFLLKGDITTMDPEHLRVVFDTLKQFIDEVHDTDRLMH